LVSFSLARDGAAGFLGSWRNAVKANLCTRRFEAFDEPWKVSFNTPGQEWEDKWGLMDPARKLKPGLKIPDCGGKTVS